MVQNPKAIITLIRNKLNSDLTLQEKIKWFHEKGITVTEKNGTWLLKADQRGHISKLTPVCNNIVFHNQYLCAFPGWDIQEISWEELQKNKNFVYDDTTVFIENIEGQKIYMYWDNIDNEWKFYSPNHLISPYTDIVKKKMSHLMSGEYCYTYTLILKEKGKNKGLYLESMFNHEIFKEESIERLVFFAKKFKIKHPKLFKIDTKLEESDLPLIVKDNKGNRFKIISL